MLSESLKRRFKILSGIPLIEEGKNHKNEYGCLMLQIDYDGWKKILDKIDKEDLYTEEEGYGLENKPHVTILFGFHDNTDIDKVKLLVKENCKEPIKVKLKSITMFENVDDKYDVLKFDVVCPSLHKLNKLMKKSFDYTSSFPEYHPHVTIAYVKSGKGKNYASKEEVEEFTCNKFLYSTKNKEKTHFKI